jgi:hypothetical protein
MYSGYHGGDPESVKAVMAGHTNMMYILAGAATLVLLMALAVYFYNKNSKKVDPTKKTTFTGHHSNWHHGSAHSGHGGHIDTVRLGSTLTGVPVKLPPLKPGEKCPGGTYLAQEKILLYDKDKTVWNPRTKKWTDVPIMDGKSQAYTLGNYYCRPGADKDPSYNAEFSKYLHHGTTLGQCTQENWDTDATTEAQALAQVGALQHDIYGEDLLQSAIDKTYSGLNTMSYVVSPGGKTNQNFKAMYYSNKKGQGYDDDSGYSDE